MRTRGRLKSSPWRAYHLAPAELPRRLAIRLDNVQREVKAILGAARRAQAGAITGGSTLENELQRALGALCEAQRHSVASLVLP